MKRFTLIWSILPGGQRPLGEIAVNKNWVLLTKGSRENVPHIDRRKVKKHSLKNAPGSEPSFSCFPVVQDHLPGLESHFSGCQGSICSGFLRSESLQGY